MSEIQTSPRLESANGRGKKKMGQIISRYLKLKVIMRGFYQISTSGRYKVQAKQSALKMPHLRRSAIVHSASGGMDVAEGLRHKF